MLQHPRARVPPLTAFMLETEQQKKARETGEFFRNLQALARPKDG